MWKSSAEVLFEGLCMAADYFHRNGDKPSQVKQRSKNFCERNLFLTCKGTWKMSQPCIKPLLGSWAAPHDDDLQRLVPSPAAAMPAGTTRPSTRWPHDDGMGAPPKLASCIAALPASRSTNVTDIVLFYLSFDIPLILLHPNANGKSIIRPLMMSARQ